MKLKHCEIIPTENNAYLLFIYYEQRWRREPACVAGVADDACT